MMQITFFLESNNKVFIFIELNFEYSTLIGGCTDPLKYKLHF